MYSKGRQSVYDSRGAFCDSFARRDDVSVILYSYKGREYGGKGVLLMKLTTTEKYALAVLEVKGKLSDLQKKERGVCLVASCIWDMMESECVMSDEKGRFIVSAPLPGSLSYCSSIYEMLQKKPMKPKKIVRDYMVTLTDKRIKSLAEDIADHLISKSALVAEQQEGLRKTKLYHVDHAIISDDMSALKHMDETVTPAQFMLAILLLKSGTAKKLLNKEELSELKKAAKEDRGEFQPYVKEMIKAVDMTITVGAAAAVSGSLS